MGQPDKTAYKTRKSALTNLPERLSETLPKQESLSGNLLKRVVGVAGFEPATPTSRKRRANLQSLIFHFLWMAGDIDYLLRVRVRDVDALKKLVQNVQQIKSVSQTSTGLVFEATKSVDELLEN